MKKKENFFKISLSLATIFFMVAGFFHAEKAQAVDATGGTITWSGGYTIHKFTGSGTFGNNVNRNVEVLVVAGGGGGADTGGGGGGGGGGAGGYIYNASFAVNAGNISVTVGNGGPNNTAGNNSVFSSLTAIGGGYGGQGDGGNGGNGGSGGGGAAPTTGPPGGSGGIPTSGQGNYGGSGCRADMYAGALSAGGGGGASAAGNNASAGCATGGNGGNGYTSSISGSSVTYSGGGGGMGWSTRGLGGSGGGGNGGSDGYASTAGNTNSGSGGGGSAFTGTGSSGGSGIVIVRYLTDNTAPTLSSKTTYSGWYTSNRTSTFTYTDASGIASGNNPTCTISAEGSGQTCTLSGAANVCDTMGNCVNPNGTVSNGANIDKTAPAFSSKTTYSGWYNANQTSTFTYTDSNSGIASGNNPTCSITTEGASQTCTLSGAANVCDVAGNCTNPNGTVSNGANIDKSAPPAPTLSCTVYTNNTWTNSSSATTCSINDTATPSTRTAVAYSTNGGSNWTDNANGLSFGFTPSEGTTNVIMRISDTGGGPTNSNTYVIKRDASAPTAGTPTIYSGTSNGNQYFVGTISIRSAIADTGGSGLNASSCQANINSGGWTGTGVTQDASYCYYNSYAPGANFTLQFRVADGTGTYGSSSTTSYTYDATAPTFSSKTTYSGWYTSNQDSTFTYTDAASGIASGNNQTCTISTEGSSQTCTLTGAANVCDNVGNCTDPNGTVSNGADIDKTAPSSNSISINSGAVATNNPDTTLTISSIDTNSGLSQMKFSCNNSDFTAAEAYGVSKAFNLTNEVTGCTAAEGARSVYVKYKDTAGNWSTAVSDDIIYDITAPTAGTPTIYSGTSNGNQYFVGTISIRSAIADTGGSGLNASSCQANINSGGWTGTGVTQDASYCYYNSYAPGANFTLQFRVADGTGAYGSSSTTSYIFTYLPTVTTQAVSAIFPTLAQGNGNITDAGGENPTRYIEWGTTSGVYPDSCDAGTGGTGNYNCSMMNLLADTPYYVRAKTTNLAGTAYGTEVSFQTAVAYPIKFRGQGIFRGFMRFK